MTTFDLEALHAGIGSIDAALPRPSAAARLAYLAGLGLDRLPLPGQGATLQRWQALAAVARKDLSLAKLYEGHTDALAILHELDAGSVAEAGSLWGVWASEAPGHRAVVSEIYADGGLRLTGSKAWCSGAASASHALMTAWLPDGQGPQLVQLQIADNEVEVSNAHWKAVGMAESASLNISLHGARARPVGGVGSYLQRPGFWHGGAGVAACWYGGAQALAEVLRRAVLDGGVSTQSGFRLAALGKVDLAMQSCAALLRQAAARIDADPLADSRALALRVRQSADACARGVLDEVGRALGATPYCRDEHFARMAADLPVFIRQSHADRDFAALGERLAEAGGQPWQL